MEPLGILQLTSAAHMPTSLAIDLTISRAVHESLNRTLVTYTADASRSVIRLPPDPVPKLGFYIGFNNI